MAGGGLRPKSGERARWRRGLGGEEARGSHGLPWEVFGGVGGGRWWVLGVGQGCGGGAARSGEGGRRGWVEELLEAEGNPFRGSAWAGDGRRWGRGVHGRRRPWRAVVAVRLGGVWVARAGQRGSEEQACPAALRGGGAGRMRGSAGS